MNKKRSGNNQYTPPYKDEQPLKMVFTKNRDGQYNNCSSVNDVSPVPGNGGNVLSFTTKRLKKKEQNKGKSAGTRHKSSHNQDNDHLNTVKGPKSIWDKYMTNKGKHKSAKSHDTLSESSVTSFDSGGIL